MRLYLELREPQQAYKAVMYAWQQIKAWTLAGHKLALIVRPVTRSTKQNALLHAVIADVAEQVEWAGKKRDAETWKRLLTASWLRARGESVEVLPALDGHGIDVVFRRTSHLTVPECTELVEFIYAWGVENGVLFQEVDN